MCARQRGYSKIIELLSSRGAKGDKVSTYNSNIM